MTSQPAHGSVNVRDGELANAKLSLKTGSAPHTWPTWCGSTGHCQTVTARFRFSRAALGMAGMSTGTNVIVTSSPRYSISALYALKPSDGGASRAIPPPASAPPAGGPPAKPRGPAPAGAVASGDGSRGEDEESSPEQAARPAPATSMTVITKNQFRIVSLPTLPDDLAPTTAGKPTSRYRWAVRPVRPHRPAARLYHTAARPARGPTRGRPPVGDRITSRFAVSPRGRAGARPAPATRRWRW